MNDLIYNNEIFGMRGNYELYSNDASVEKN